MPIGVSLSLIFVEFGELSSLNIFILFALVIEFGFVLNFLQNYLSFSFLHLYLLLLNGPLPWVCIGVFLCLSL